MNKDVTAKKAGKPKIQLLKQKIADKDYMTGAINRIAAELTVFLCK